MVWSVVNESNSFQYPGTHSHFCIIPYTYSRPGLRSYYSDLLQAGLSGDPIPLEAEFSAPFLTGPDYHPDSYTEGIGYFPGVKLPGRDADHPPPPSADVRERGGLWGDL